MELSSLSFDSRDRVCCGCFKVKNSTELLKCSRCQVFVYCNKDCQLKGWKELSHKTTCKPRAPRAGATTEEGLPRDKADPEDMDRPYAFIQIATRGTAKYPLPDKASFMACSSGSDDDTVVVQLMGKRESAALCARFSWPSGIPGKILVPGYCSEWDKTTLYCYADDNYLSESGLRAAEHHNPIASYALMISPELPKAVRGSALFFCVDDDGKLIKITRRDILSLATRNQTTGSDDAVPERVRFENMRRASYLEGLKKMNFQTLSL